MAELSNPEDILFKGTIDSKTQGDLYASCLPWIRGRRVLNLARDFGPGSSMVTVAESIIGINIDWRAGRYGSEKQPGVLSVAADIVRLPFAQRSFDTVVCLDSISHVFRTEVLSFIAEAYRVLAADGHFVIHFPVLSESRHSGNPSSLFEYTPQDLTSLLGIWFETLATEFVSGPEGPAIWFVGRRRTEPLEGTACQAPEEVAKSVIAGTLEWANTLLHAEGASYAPGRPVTGISTCLAILHLDSACSLDKIDEGTLETWLQTILQAWRVDAGLFEEPLLRLFPPESPGEVDYLCFQTTYFALAALAVVGQKAPGQLTFLDTFLETGAVERWLDDLDWSDPRQASNRVIFLLSSFIYVVEEEDCSEFAEPYHRILTWLGDHQDLRTGLGRTNRGASLLDTASGAYLFVPFYEYVRRPIPKVNHIIDSVLALQQGDGLFGPVEGGDALEDLYAIDVLSALMRHTSHRQREVRTALVRAWWAIWNIRNENGSFPYAARRTQETYSFANWSPLTAGRGAGDILSTWLRIQALATVPAVLPGDVPPVPLKFRNKPGLGYRSDGTLADRDRKLLLRWIRPQGVPQRESAETTKLFSRRHRLKQTRIPVSDAQAAPMAERAPQTPASQAVSQPEEFGTTLDTSLPSSTFGMVKTAWRNTVILASVATSTRKVRNLFLFGNILLKGPKRVLWNQHFNAAAYLKLNPDVKRSGASAALHYAVYGCAELRSCSTSFDSSFYLQRHPDVEETGLPPLIHYVLFGSEEGRRALAFGMPTDHPVGELARTPDPPLDPIPQDVPLDIPVSEVRFHSHKSPAQSPEDGKPLITVVIPCFNYGRFVADALSSVRAQTLNEIVETIVVEGGSTDGSTPSQVKELEAQGFPRTRFLYRSEPHLTGDNRNFGIAAARGKYIICLDADDGLNPIYLEVAIFLAETRGYDIVYPSVQAFDADNFLWSLRNADAATISQYNQISTVAMFRITAWRQVGGFRDWGRGQEYVAEDWDFWVRLLRSGRQARCIPEPLHRYRVHPTGIWHGERSSMKYQQEQIAASNADLIAKPFTPEQLSPNPNGWRDLLNRTPEPSGALLLALPFLSIGGAERVFESVARAMTEQGRKVVVITTLSLGETVKNTWESFQSITPMVYPLQELFGNDRGLWDEFVSYLIDQHSVDMIMIAGCDYIYEALPHLAAAFPHIGIVDQLFNDQVHFPTNRRYAAYIDVTMVPSQPFADRMVKEFRETPFRVAVIPHGVEIPECPTEEDVAAARARSGIPVEWLSRPIAGYFGRMSPEKAPADFVAIMNMLQGDPDLAFIMTGDGPELAKVQKSIDECGLRDRVYMPGFVENPRDLMMSVDVVVVPSRLDGMPLVVMEGQALAKIVVASSVGSIPAMIEHDVTGVLCTPGDIAEFAAAVWQLLLSPTMRSRIGRSARKSVERRHGASAMIQGYNKAFDMARMRRPAQEQQLQHLPSVS